MSHELDGFKPQRATHDPSVTPSEAARAVRLSAADRNVLGGVVTGTLLQSNGHSFCRARQHWNMLLSRCCVNPLPSTGRGNTERRERFIPSTSYLVRRRTILRWVVEMTPGSGPGTPSAARVMAEACASPVSATTEYRAAHGDSVLDADAIFELANSGVKLVEDQSEDVMDRREQGEPRGDRGAVPEVGHRDA